MNELLSRIAKVYNITPESIFMRSRKRRISDARLMYIIMTDKLGIVNHEWYYSVETNFLKRGYKLLETDKQFHRIYTDIVNGAELAYEDYFGRCRTGGTYFYMCYSKVCEAIDNDDYMAYKRHREGNYFFTAAELYKSRRSK